MVGIYKITSPSGKIYIGQSWNIQQRKRQHRAECKRSDSKIHASLKKYGFDNHTFEVLIYLNENIDQTILDWHEILFIDYFESNGYKMLNLKEGGSNGKWSDEAKSKMIGHKRMLGKKHSEETKEKIRLSRIGIKFSEEQCKKISDAKKGKPNLKTRGIKHTEEHINKWKMSYKGYKHTEQAKKNMGDSHRGIPHKDRKLTDEQIREIRSYPKPLEYGMTEILAKKYNVSKGTIYNIRSNWRYTNVK